MSKLDDYEFDSSRLGVGEIERAFLSAGEQTHGNPQRKALANLYNSIGLILLPIALTLWFCVPAAIWWAYSAATR